MHIEYKWRNLDLAIYNLQTIWRKCELVFNGLVTSCRVGPRGHRATGRYCAPIIPNRSVAMNAQRISPSYHV